jgi:signal transduction histidine kinase
MSDAAVDAPLLGESSTAQVESGSNAAFPARRLTVGVVPFAAVVAAVVVGLQADVRGGLAATSATGMGLAIVWGLAGLAAMAHPRTRAAGGLTLAGATVGAVTLAAQRLEAGGGDAVARTVATLGGPLVVAVSVHLLLALPTGQLGDQVRRAATTVVYVIAVISGVGMALAARAVPAAAIAVAWPAAVLLSLPALRARYQTSVGPDRDRLQWAGIGVLVAGDAALVTAVLHALVGWPRPIGAVAACATVMIPIGSIAGDWPRLAGHGGRLFVQLLSIAGFTVVVSAIYLVVVLGLGHAPTNAADREVLGLSMLAAAIAAVGYVPARDRFVRSATRFVYGARQAPDEVLRTFGSRLTRAVSMEELLLQLAESLRKTMGLTSAEIYSGAGDVLELAVSVPDAGHRPIVLSGRERPVVARAGVSGTAWASVWLPGIVEGRHNCQLRVAPVSHSGDLLGLIVVVRAAAAEAFSEEDDRVLTDLAREVGLAFHNVRLDAALQTTLEELRKQAEDLRESRARIVASGDAERRRVERNLHDGAQQRLVALAVNLRLARDVVADDAAAGAEMLDQLVVEVQATVQELRELAHGIYPPLLVDSGLVAALRAATNRSPLAVELVAEGVGRYPAEVEAAIYFCCLEAMQNAAKHAPDASVELTVRAEGGGLVFSVVDDGPGFDAETARRGHGFVNMSDRVGAIGGTVRWESEPGHGARVHGSIPLVT